MREIVRAPFTPEQVASLNDYQDFGTFHPFTCGGEHPGGSPNLVATEAGWVCSDPKCSYTQDWAHPWMTDDSWKQLLATVQQRLVPGRHR